MKQRIWFVVYAATVALAFVSIMFFPSGAHANTVRGNAEACSAMASDLNYATGLRDAGVPLTVILNMVENYIGGSLMNPGASYIKDTDDGDLFRAAVKSIYRNPGLTPEKIEAEFLEFCIKPSI